jgi:hypothetical protein
LLTGVPAGVVLEEALLGPPAGNLLHFTVPNLQIQKINILKIIKFKKRKFSR